MILVTGGAGYIGSHCVKELLDQHYDVLVLDNLSRGRRSAVLAKHFVEADLRNAEAVTKVLRTHKIEAVVHFAALIQVGESITNPLEYYDNNVLGTWNLLRAMVDCGVENMVFSSSAAVYGIPDQTPIPEDHAKKPINPYGRTKWIVEQMLEDCARAHGIRYAALRYFNAAGCDPEGKLDGRHDPETHLIPIILEVALGKRRQLAIYGTDYDTPDGTCVRDYIHVSDLAVAHILALKHLQASGKSGAYNLGTGEGHSVREVVECCRAVTGRPIPVLEGDRREGDPAQLIADPRRAMADLAWKPCHPSLEDMVRTAWRVRSGRG